MYSCYGSSLTKRVYNLIFKQEYIYFSRLCIFTLKPKLVK